MAPNAVRQEKNQVDQLLLQQAFERFNEASTLLQQKYEVLLRESERLREELALKDQAVRRSEKLSLLGQTAAAIAHEVRNPLGAVKLFLSLLRRDLVDRPDALKLMNEIDKGVNSVENVVSNILQFSRDERVEFAPLNLHAIIAEQKTALQLNLESGAVLDFNLRANPFINGDEQALRRCISNLMINALQATRYRGRVTVETSDQGQNQVLITVRDDGPGISPALLDKIFEPFVTSRKEGTGLGLAIVRQIVEQHGGSISCHNCGGAEFVICLPRLAVNRHQTMDVSNAQALPSSNREIKI
ncbi:MAG: hypothetical protein K1X83_03855 [Oligoflexia bacterium]|nr:hypothetical protein [Oligoflexia bacterium]